MVCLIYKFECSKLKICSIYYVTGVCIYRVLTAKVVRINNQTRSVTVKFSIIFKNFYESNIKLSSMN